MASQEHVLIVCREQRDLRMVDQPNNRAQQSFIIASDNIHVQQAVARKPWVSKVCFIEQIESLYTVADDVMRLQTTINQWLASLATDGEGVPKSLLYFVKHAEGGMTTQRIQDALLLIRSYQALFRESSASRVILRRRISSRWEDDVLVHTARGGGLEVEEHYSILYCIGQKLNLVAVDRYLFGRIRRVYVPSRLINHMRQARLYINIVRAKLNPRNRAEAGDGRPQIAFLLGASTDKHVDNIVPLMMEFQRRRTYQPLAVCWSAANGAAKVRSHALQAYELEASFPLSRLRQLLERVHRTQARAHAKKDELRDNSSLMYESVALAPLLWPSFDYFLGFQVVK